MDCGLLFKICDCCYGFLLLKSRLFLHCYNCIVQPNMRYKVLKRNAKFFFSFLSGDALGQNKVGYCEGQSLLHLGATILEHSSQGSCLVSSFLAFRKWVKIDFSMRLVFPHSHYCSFIGFFLVFTSLLEKVEYNCCNE